MLLLFDPGASESLQLDPSSDVRLRYVAVYVAALRTVPMGQLVLVSVIGPLVAPEGAVALTSPELR